MRVSPHTFDHVEEGLPSFHRLGLCPLLTADEERIITRAARDGNKEAKRKLIEANMRLVINTAKSYKNRSIPLEDLIQEGALGLICATERFDPDKGFRFSTYAMHWIRQSISRALDSKAKTIRLPAHILIGLRKLEREKAQLIDKLNREPSLDELAEAMGMSSKKLQLLYQASLEIVSLDMTFSDGVGPSFGSNLRDPHQIENEPSVNTEGLLSELQKYISNLDEREQRVLEYKFSSGNINSNDHLDEASIELKLSRERLRQIEVKAIRKLRALAALRPTMESSSESP